MRLQRPDRRHLETFVAVIERGNFAGAARDLGITPSAVSQTLRQLEAMVGRELFIRTARPFTLTAAGRDAELYARRSLQDLDAFVSTASEQSGLLSGQMSICTIPTQSTHPVAALVGEFRARHPNVRVDIIQPKSRSIADVSLVVSDGLADVGITELPTVRHGLRVLEFVPQEFVAILPPQSQHAGHAISPAELVEHGLVIGPYFETSVAYTVLKKYAPQIDSSFQVRTDHRESFPYLVAQGVGASLVNRDNTATARELGCRVVDFDPPLLRRAGVVYSGKYLTPAAQAFVEICRTIAT